MTHEDQATGKPKQPNNPLHGVTLQAILEHLLAYYDGWEQLGYNIPINCFTDNPSMSSSLKFLRRTPWARKKVETLYLATLDYI
ncbi:VF530 family protein [Taibaiella koreensis]|uniref:VF530 family protein n=1 Tax=Taibaiella koreensis TaxID=1268548 RepID=UPI000E59F90A|nr:VF530 family protein [Taibaiella koreensis]